MQFLPKDGAHLAFLSLAKWCPKDTLFQRFSTKPKFFETKRATEFATVVPPGKRVRALVGAPYNSTGAEFDICTYFSAKDDVNSVSFRDNATRGDEMELTCPPDSSASISKAEQIPTFCIDAQCDNIAFACDRDSKLANNDVIIEDNLENKVLRTSQVIEVNEFSRLDVCRSDEGNNEGFR